VLETVNWKQVTEESDTGNSKAEKYRILRSPKVGPSPPKEDVRRITTSKNVPHKVRFETSD
jgi:hypothetical protein